MSRDVYETYERAIDLATDSGQAPGLLLSQIEIAFGLDIADSLALQMRNALWRRIGLVRCEVVIDGANFDVPSRHQGPSGWLAWVMPVVRTPALGGGGAEYEDLIAFCDEGKHAGKVWRLLGSVDAVGLPFETDRRTLTVFTQPKLWLQYWLKACRAESAPEKCLEAAETGPEAFAALVLDPKKVRWAPIVDVHSTIPLSIQEVRFPDSAELRALVEKEMRLKLPALPRLRAAKGLPETEAAGT